MSNLLTNEICRNNIDVFLVLKNGEKLMINDDFRVDVDARYFSSLRRNLDRLVVGVPTSRETTKSIIDLTYQSVKLYPQMDTDLVIKSLINLKSEMCKTYTDYPELETMIEGHLNGYLIPSETIVENVHNRSISPDIRTFSPPPVDTEIMANYHPRCESPPLPTESICNQSVMAEQTQIQLPESSDHKVPPEIHLTSSHTFDRAWELFFRRMFRICESCCYPLCFTRKDDD
jgi:hypothetical protein